MGDIDDVKEVAEGYARNFLFPKHLAVQATESATTKIETKHTKEIKLAERDLHDQQAVAAKINGFEMELKEKSSKQGVLYAAVTPQKVAEALQRRGYKLDPKQLIMKPIKELGHHVVRVKFRHGFEAEITVDVNTTN